jgi:hypothetical protein
MSNAMKISQMIATLQGILDKNGDLDVVCPNQAADTVFAVQFADLAPQAGWPWKSLLRPVLSIEPKDVYAASPAPDDGWTYDLSAAPEGVVVRVMKRRGGEDTGQRHGDVWSVFEGADGPGARAWEVAPGGVLAWRAMQ